MTLRKRSLQSAANPPVRDRNRWTSRWFEKLMAAIALTNLGLVAFDLSYVPWRDLYLRQFPELTQWYGATFKGMEPHRATDSYLATVAQLQEQVAQTGLQSAEATALLARLRQQSNELIDEDPFQIANKSGTLERIKNRMRDQVGVESSKQAFATFWSPDYLSQRGWSTEIGFFDSRIRPLIETNYYRGIGVDGKPIDLFLAIDLCFIGLFGLEFLARTFYLSRRYKGASWFDAMLWRWYDLFLLIPIWQWLRVIPVTMRLNQSKLVNLEPLGNKISNFVLSSIAVELTEVVVLRIIDQFQNLVKQGDIARWLIQPGSSQRYVDLNGVDEVQAIAQRLVNLVVYQVLPTLKPEIEALLQHSVISVLNSSPVYRGLQPLPGMTAFSNQLAQQLVQQVSQNAYGAITAALQDAKGAELTQQLVQRFSESLRSNVQQENTVEDIQSLVTALLDEVKINYVQRLADEDVEKLREQNHQLYQQMKSSNQ